MFICESLRKIEFACVATVIGSFTLCCQAPNPSSCSTGNLVFARVNLKPSALKNLVFDWEMCFRVRKVYGFQNLVGLELPIRHTLNWLWNKIQEDF